MRGLGSRGCRVQGAGCRHCAYGHRSAYLLRAACLSFTLTPTPMPLNPKPLSGFSTSVHPSCYFHTSQPQTVRANSLFKLENRNRTRLVQKPKWTRHWGKSENVYSGTRTLCLIDMPRNLVHFGFCTNLVGFRFSSLNKLFARTVWP